MMKSQRMAGLLACLSLLSGCNRVSAAIQSRLVPGRPFLLDVKSPMQVEFRQTATLEGKGDGDSFNALKHWVDTAPPEERAAALKSGQIVLPDNTGRRQIWKVVEEDCITSTTGAHSSDKDCFAWHPGPLPKK